MRFLLAALLLSGCALQREHLKRDLHFARYRLMSGPWKMDCAAEGAAKYCVFETKDAGQRDDGSTIWFLHYATGDEKSLARLGLANALYRSYRRRSAKVPRLVAVSYGTHWVFSDRPGKRQTVSTSIFLDKTLPSLEDKLGKTPRNYLWGMSQGGYNALQLLLGKPQKWDGAAVSCPALYAEDPFAPGAAEQLAARAHAPEPWVADGMELFTTRMTEEAWKAEEPIARLKSAADPPLLIQANVGDEYGFIEGARALAKAAKEKGDSVALQEEPGSHCVNDALQVGGFLSSLVPR